MGRKGTREQFIAREIPQDAPSKGEAQARNKREIAKFQSTLKPIRSSQK